MTLTDSLFCPYCQQPFRADPPANPLSVCTACGFVFPRPHQVKTETTSLSNPELALAVPSGVLRERYRLLHVVGQGAHGLTCFAEHLLLNHHVVVKLLRHRSADPSDAAAARLRHEARLGFRVNDPNVVRVLDCDVIEGWWFFVMEYVDGVDLRAILAQRKCIGWQQARRFLTDTARGLAAIHRARLVHRDIKPGNLLLTTTGEIKVADLGVAARADGASEGEPEPDVPAAGTLEYAAPETFDPAAPADIRADLYSLGVTVFQLMTGRLPHGTRGGLSAVLAAQRGRVVWPTEVAANTPQWFVQALLRLLSADPADRFLDPEALLEYLKHPTPQTIRTTPSESNGAAALEPRGVAVAAFRNIGAPDDAWMGYAIADYVGRCLLQLPGVFAIAQDQLARVLPANPGPANPDALRQAGRLLGAGTILTGSHRRDGDAVEYTLESMDVDGSEPLVVGTVRGALSRQIDLQAELMDLVRGLLRVDPAGNMPRAAPAPLSLDAQPIFVLAKQAYLRGDYAAAIELGRRALAVDEDNSELFGFLGICFARRGRYKEAAEQHTRHRELAERRGDQRGQAEAYANLGAMEYFKGEYEAAYGYYAQAASLAERLSLSSELAQIYNNLGFVLFRLGKADEAERAFTRSIEIHKSFGALVSLVSPYNGLGNVLLDQQRYDEAREYYRRALLLAQEIGDRTKVGVSHVHLARCAYLQGRFGEAKNEFTLALTELEPTDFWNGQARAYEFMSEMNLQLGNLQEAIRCAEAWLALARRHENKTMEQAARRKLEEARQRLGESKGEAVEDGCETRNGGHR